jgi:hypothetical protein
MNTILCLLQKIVVLMVFVGSWLLDKVAVTTVNVGKWLTSHGTVLSSKLQSVLSHTRKQLIKECPPFRWPDKLSFWILLSLFVLGWLISRFVYHPTSGQLDLSWFGGILMSLLILAIVIGLVYALRHIIPWIAGILAILGLVSALASAPSCSTPSVSTATPEKTTEYCWFYEECFWKDKVIHWPTFSFPSYCWFWEACYSSDNQESSGYSTPIIAPTPVTPEKTTEYCWFWDSCFWQQLFDDNDHVVMTPTVIKPTKIEEAKVSQPEAESYTIKSGDTLWKLAGGDPLLVDTIANLNAGVLDPYWIKNCHHISNSTNKWCAEPKHTLQIGMNIFIPIHK